MEKYYDRKKPVTRQPKNPCFSLSSWATPSEFQQKPEDNSSAAKKKHRRVKEWAENQRTRKTENPIVPMSLLMRKKEELIRGPGSDILLIELGRRRHFRTLFFGGLFQKL